MIVDPFTVAAFTALVIVVSATLFLIDTVRRHDAAPGQLWSLGYLAAVLTTVSYLVWAWQPETWWAVSAGNAAYIVATGGMWLGCRAFNRKPVGLAGIFVAATSVLVGAATSWEWEDLGDWAGAVWMFAALMVLAGMAAVECFTGELHRARVARPLGIVFCVQSAYYLARSIAFLAAGPHSALFQTWFSTAITSVLTVTLTITAVVATSVLQSTRSRIRGGIGAATVDAAFAVRPRDVFRRDLDELCARAQRRDELVAVAIVHFDDLASIERAYGADVSDELWEALRAGVLDGSPALVLVGETDGDSLGVAWVAASAADARRHAMALYRSLLTGLDAVTGGALPGVGVGVALSDVNGYGASGLLTAAAGAAERGAAGWTTAVVLADPL
ncbi:diguanylate cyclase [Microbacterium telephonicum]|uniref:GGDEF domain-containing protein n=1 Tax=Microbacterium telephonicum TaxID=1714841 RepID=A0A498CB82_9MICO|nr:diguanylate cyclase [Microbacterium telephonicum]RLK49618.1 GGDEF domain-containing protein [Microbacterium telephonicum]